MLKNLRMTEKRGRKIMENWK